MKTGQGTVHVASCGLGKKGRDWNGSGLISNTNILHFDYCLKKFPILRTLDKWILSHEIGYKKSAIEIFQRAIEWASVEPQKILFIDDMKKHVGIAVSLGMQSIYFISAKQLKEKLYMKLNSNSKRKK